MVRYYHSDGTAVVPDNDQEKETMWGLLDHISDGAPAGIPIETWKKVAGQETPRLECSSYTQAIEMASVMNDFRDGHLVRAMFKMLTMTR